MTVAYASTTPSVVEYTKQQTLVSIPEISVATQSIEDKIRHYADEYSVPFYVIDDVVRCESNYEPGVVGDSGESFGIAQIHLPAHKDITEDQALDPDFSLNFMAENISKGKGRMWSCFRSLFPNGF